jgi:DNA-binding NtrC family response regulator
MLHNPDRPVVLVVDDDDGIRLTVTEALEGAGYEVAAVSEALEAIARLNEPYDVVLLDLWLPGLGGMDVLRHIERTRPALPVVIMTAHGSVPAAVEAMKLGACEFIEKPFTVEEIRDVVAKALHRVA